MCINIEFIWCAIMDVCNAYIDYFTLPLNVGHPIRIRVVTSFLNFCSTFFIYCSLFCFSCDHYTIENKYWEQKINTLLICVANVCFVQVYTYKQNAVSRQRVYSMHSSSINGVEDMATLQDLHDGAILHNLQLRYTQKSIYVSKHTAKSPTHSI